MAIVNLTPLHDVEGGTAGSTATIVATVMSGRKPAVRVEGEEITFPLSFTVTVSGAGEFELVDLPAECYYFLSVQSADAPTTTRCVVLPGGPGPFDYEDLVDVDPATTLPSTGPATLTDEYIAGRVRDSTSATTSALSETYVTFLRHDGTPLEGDRFVVITLTEDETDIDNIAVYDSIGEVG